MKELRQPIYQWGQTVFVDQDLLNDGSYPDQPTEALLVKAGSKGAIVQIGHHEEANIPIYLVEFEQGMVIGCFEEEIRADRSLQQLAGIL